MWTRIMALKSKDIKKAIEKYEEVFENENKSTKA